MKRTRAKFVCNVITRTMGGRYREEQGEQVWVPEPVITVEMTPVAADDDNPENKEFWDATPSGKLELQCVHEEAVKHLEVGKEYYLDIVPADGQ